MKPKTTPPKNHSKLKTFSILLFAILIAGGGMLLYKNHQNNQAIAKERAQYAQAEKDLDGLAGDIITKFGEPVKRGSLNTCGYTSVEFGKGDLYCSTSRGVTYAVQNKTDAQRITDQASDFLKTNSHFTVVGKSTTFANSSSPPPTDLLSLDLRSQTSLSCSMSFTYYLDSDRAQGSPELSKVPVSGLRIGLSCGSRPALTAYYPLEKE